MLINTKDLLHLKENGNSTLEDYEKELKISSSIIVMLTSFPKAILKYN